MKDPAVLFYVKDWLVSTASMPADARGWYLNLLLHNYDHGDLPVDIEDLAVLAGVRMSEWERFVHVFEHLLKHKFEQTDEQGRMSNPKMGSILQARELFKEKRSDAGKKSYLMRFFRKNFSKQAKNKALSMFVSENVDCGVDTKNEQELKQMFEQVCELYINANANANKIEVKDKGVQGEKEDRVVDSVYGDGRLHWLCREYDKQYPDAYSKDLYDAFLFYWTATTKTGHELWRTREAFSLAGRLRTWISNEKSKQDTNGKKQYMHDTASGLNAIFERKATSGSFGGAAAK